MLIVTSDEFDKSCKSVQEYWDGVSGMDIATIEEAAELIKAITKYSKTTTASTYQDLIDELGDMYISLKALQYHYNIPDDDINKRIDKKLHKKY